MENSKLMQEFEAQKSQSKNQDPEDAQTVTQDESKASAPLEPEEVETGCVQN